VVFAATIAGGLVAARVLDDGPDRSGAGAVPVPSSSSTTSTSTTAGPLPACTLEAGADPAAVEVCTVDALVAVLRQDAGLDEVAATCAAESVVDELGVPTVLAALETGVPPAGLRQRLQTAFAACVEE
jgi:hypothetical protein